MCFLGYKFAKKMRLSGKKFDKKMRLYDALDQHAVRNGLFGRCLVVRAEDEYRANLPTERSLSPDLVKTAKALVELERRIDDSGVLRSVVAAETPEAAELLRRSAAANMALRKRLAEANLPSARALVVRVNEKVSKLALLHAISADPGARSCASSMSTTERSSASRSRCTCAI